MARKRRSNEPAPRRKLGVENLVRRGWSKARIAQEAKVSIDNMRELMRPGRGHRSEHGLRLDGYLDRMDAFNDKAFWGPDEEPAQGEKVRELAADYSAPVQFPVAVPSPAALDDAEYRAESAKDKRALDQLRVLRSDIFELRRRSEDIMRRFDSIKTRMNGAA